MPCSVQRRVRYDDFFLARVWRGSRSHVLPPVRSSNGSRLPLPRNPHAAAVAHTCCTPRRGRACAASARPSAEWITNQCPIDTIWTLGAREEGPRGSSRRPVGAGLQCGIRAQGSLRACYCFSGFKGSSRAAAASKFPSRPNGVSPTPHDFSDFSDFIEFSDFVASVTSASRLQLQHPPHRALTPRDFSCPQSR
eukprot:304102-Chlamydomonas_euryale.AAC.3